MKYSVLVVEDEFDVLENISEILTINEYKVLKASNGKEAINILEESVPDLILSDIIMPSVNGFELLDYVQSSEKQVHVPFVFLTAKSARLEIRKGLQLGADDYLTKPFKSNELLSMIKARLEKKELYYKQWGNNDEDITPTVPSEYETPHHQIIDFPETIIENTLPSTSTKSKTICKQMKSNSLQPNTIDDKSILFSSLDFDFAELNNEFTSVQITKNPDFMIRKTAFSELIHSNRTHEIEFDIPKCSIKIDENNFQICIKELVENACKFSTPGSTIRIFGAIISNNFVLAIQNDGVGISHKRVNQVNMLNNVNNPEVQDTGLGLPIVKKIVEFFGGEFELESKPYIYTRVTIQLPIILN